MRAQRYAIALPMRYRRVGEETWATGTTVNISRSGVVFEGERSVDREAAIELVLTMPVDVADGARVVARRSEGTRLNSSHSAKSRMPSSA